MDFKNYIKAVGTGPKGNRELSFEESIDMMKQILMREIPNEMISAFLLGWRLKPETLLEYRGALSALDSMTQLRPVKNSIELGYPFDGKASHPYLLPLISKILRPFDLNLVVMGDELQPAKAGITIKNLMSHLTGFENIFYFDRKDYSVQLHNLTEIRMMLGVRTAFNTIEKLPKIADSKFAMTGVFHRPYVKKYNDIFENRYERFALLQGNEGAPELFNKARLWVNADNKLEEFFINPEEFGIDPVPAIDGITLENTIDILNDPSENITKLAKLNAAILLFLAGKYQSITEGFESLN